MLKRKLPIGIQTFREMREERFYYVDKTKFAQGMVEGGKLYFLSRPRRFGKSLFLDTLKELFEGSEALFRGLHIHDQWDWDIRHPVVRLHFGAGDFTDPARLTEDVHDQLATLEEANGVSSRPDASPPIRLRHLVAALREQAGQRVAVLVDEYDKPILDALGTPAAAANRQFLRALYAVVKQSDAHIKFAFLAGVSKFSKVSLFSDLNNLKDITLDRRYAAVCGYTEQDLDDVFAEALAGFDRDEVRRWYNGYSWRGQRVYNPFDILLLLDEGEFRAHWFETGSPKFLIDELRQRGVPSIDLDGMTTSEALLSTFDVDEMAVEALLFQTGYLTILDEKHQDGRIRYRLGYPNLEVRQSLNEHLLRALLPEGSRRQADDAPLRELFAANDFEGLEGFFRSLFAGIPHQWHVNNDIGNFEGYYASVVYSCFAAQGFELVAEDSTSAGRSDMVVRCDDAVYLFEFKLSNGAPEGGALAQIKRKGYADKYRSLRLPIYLIGVEFGKTQRNVAAFDVERA